MPPPPATRGGCATLIEARRLADAGLGLGTAPVIGAVPSQAMLALESRLAEE